MYQPEQPVFDQAIESNIEITYGIEDVPKPWWKSLYFAVQITLVDFTPFVWGGMFVSLAGLDAATVLPTMISACFLVMGICTLIQTTIGNRLPIVQGPSASLASSMGSVAAYLWSARCLGLRHCRRRTGNSAGRRPHYEQDPQVPPPCCSWFRSSSYRLCSCPYRCSVDFLLSGC